MRHYDEKGNLNDKGRALADEVYDFLVNRFKRLRSFVEILEAEHLCHNQVHYAAQAREDHLMSVRVDKALRARKREDAKWRKRHKK